MSNENPAVLCVMLATGREAMVRRSIQSWCRQSYSNRVLVVFDNGREPLSIVTPSVVYRTRLEYSGAPRPIGELRNLANALSIGGALDCEIIAHWDSDDYSSPARIEEQVRLLQFSKAPAVGYHDMVFWDTSDGNGGEAWLYRSANPDYCLGTSLMYWRATWQKYPFEPIAVAEDLKWLHRVKAKAISSVTVPSLRMIATIHGGNTTAKVQRGFQEWRRKPEHDRECREVFGQ